MNQIKSKSRSVFICYTPLHVLLTKQIIKLEKLSSFIVVYYYYTDSDKSRYYFNQIAQYADKAFYVHKNSRLPHTVKVLLTLALNVRRRTVKFPTVYGGNIKSIYSRFLVFFLRTRKLHTFDDGVGNVCGEGYFYEGLTATRFSRLAGLIGLDFSYSRMRELIKKHYTIYTAPNIMPHSEYIRLFDFAPDAAATSDSGNTAVLLTSTLYEDGFLSLEHEKKLYSKIIQDFNVKFIIPHPLELHGKIENPGVSVINSEKIAEDIVMDLRQYYSHITVIGWYSSALIHLAGIAGIEAVNVHVATKLSLDTTREFFESSQVRTYIPNLES